MKKKEKVCSIALASTFIILFLILVSSTASASNEKDLHRINPPDLTSGAMDPSADKVLSDELSTEGKSIVTAAPIIIETQITNNTSSQWYPAIYGNRIVWIDYRNGNSDIYMYDLSTSTETQIPATGSSKYCPDIYGDRIVWTDYRSGNDDIYMYDLSTSTETQITTDGSDQWDPAIYGNRIVWIDNRNGYNNWDIYMYDISTSTETQITTDGSSQYDPAIYGNRIVWTDERNAYGDEQEWESDIYMYDISTSTETQITGWISDWSPDIYGDRIVWDNWGGGDYLYDLYMYDLSTSTTKRITTTNSLKGEPAIYGNRIVWMDDQNGNSDIYMYDLSTSTETQITANGSRQEYPAVYGNRIVWQDYRNENNDRNYDIYMGTITASPVAAFSASPTSGKAPLNVTFKDKSTGSPTKWKWTFGDGTNSTQRNPTHRYRAEGNYTVKLTATNAAGSNTTTKKNYIKVTTNTRPGIYSENK